MDESYKLIDLGIITLEWPTALFTLGLFLVVIYLLNEFLFKPVINNLENRKNFINQNQQKHAEITADNEKLTQEIARIKTNHWDELKIKRSQIIREAELAANKELADKQLAARRNIEKEKALLNEALAKILPNSKEYLVEIQASLSKKYLSK